MATSSSIGSDIFAVVSLLVISLLVLILIRHYLPLRSTPGYLLVPVFLTLALPCSIILLVPIDLASTANAENEGPSKGVWLPERVLLAAWRICYWLTFVLTWFILPLLGEYCDSGYRETKERVIYSLRSNARYQLIVLTTAVLGFVYFVLQNGFHTSSIKGLVMALAYAWGLILVIGLMGHGLVTLPRDLYRNARVSGRLRRLQARAPKIKDKLDEAMDELEVLENTVMQLKQRKLGINHNMQEWIDELADTSSLPESRPGMAAAIRGTNPSIPAVVTERYLAELTRKIKRARHKKARFVDEWANLCQEAQDKQTILDAASSQKLDFGREGPNTRNSKVLTPSMRFYLHSKVIPYSRMALSALFAGASVLVVWSEVISSFAPKLSIIGLSVVHHPESDRSRVPFIGQLLAAMWLFYMDACALYAISAVKVWGNRALVKRQTYAESACWYSLQVAKLTVPLSYNFITMMPGRDIYRQTSFYTFLGKLINLTPLGSGFSTYFPCFILVPVLASLFNLYGKAKNTSGFGVLEDDEDENPSGFGTGGWREGRTLIEREFQIRADGATAVGLASRGASLDQERRLLSSSATTTRPFVGTRRDGNTSNIAEPRTRAADRQFNSITNEEETDADDSPRHFYQDIGERMRNTFDSAESPGWVRNLGAGLSAPRWMQNDQRDDTGGSALSKWFGGRAEDGRLRL